MIDHDDRSQWSQTSMNCWKKLPRMKTEDRRYTLGDQNKKTQRDSYKGFLWKKKAKVKEKKF